MVVNQRMEASSMPCNVLSDDQQAAIYQNVARIEELIARGRMETSWAGDLLILREFCFEMDHIRSMVPHRLLEIATSTGCIGHLRDFLHAARDKGFDVAILLAALPPEADDEWFWSIGRRNRLVQVIPP